MRSIAVAVVFVLWATACGTGELMSLTYQASPTVQRFGLTERCGPSDRSCESAAYGAVAEALRELEGAYEGDGLTSTDTPPTDRLFIQVVSSSGVPYSSPDGAGGAHDVVFDLTSFGEGVGTPYVVVRTDTGVERYGVDADLAEDLLMALYMPTD